jgi:hypothetical protein
VIAKAGITALVFSIFIALSFFTNQELLPNMETGENDGRVSK